MPESLRFSHLSWTNDFSCALLPYIWSLFATVSSLVVPKMISNTCVRVSLPIIQYCIMGRLTRTHVLETYHMMLCHMVRDPRAYKSCARSITYVRILCYLYENRQKLSNLIFVEMFFSCYCYLIICPFCLQLNSTIISLFCCGKYHSLILSISLHT